MDPEIPLSAPTVQPLHQLSLSHGGSRQPIRSEDDAGAIDRRQKQQLRIVGDERSLGTHGLSHSVLFERPVRPRDMAGEAEAGMLCQIGWCPWLAMLRQ